MPHRSYASTANYRFGFNGKENDNESKGLGNQQDYGMRVYDTRIGRFLSVDPITKDYPQITPYQYASDRPIDGLDFDGLEFFSANDHKVTVGVSYDPQLQKVNSVQAYLFYPNVINGFKEKIHSYFKLQGNYWDNDLSPGGISLGRFVPIEDPLSMNNLQGGLSEKEGKGGALEFRYETKTKVDRIVKYKTPILGYKTNVVKFKEGEEKADKFSAYIEGAKILLERGYVLYEDNIEIPEIESQSNKMSLNVYKYITKAINEKMIPSDYLNSDNLTSIGNYLVSGEIPLLPTYTGEKIVNQGLLDVAKKVWGLIATDRKNETISQQNAAANKDLPTTDKTRVNKREPPKIRQ